MGIIIPLLLITFCCIIIWKAGDGFMIASEYIGRNLSEGVKGATINAVASSMPEVFTSLFFLFVLGNAEGFSGGIGTTAGSAVFNGMVIPAVAVLTVIGMKLTKKVHLSRKVLLRDGISLIIAELIFLILISGSSLHWYHGMLLMMVYVVYIIYMFASMKKSQRKAMLEGVKVDESVFESKGKPNGSLLKGLITFDLRRVFIGEKKIDNKKAWSLLISSTLFIALVCYFLVLACEWIGADTYSIDGLGEFNGLNIPVIFVALILASAASSFPDTIISIKDAKKGRYDDAVSNVLGSNIFDICVALGLPLFIFTIIHGPIYMPPEVVALSSELRLLLWLLTVVAIVIFISGDYFGKFKSYFLLSLYVAFVIYIVGRGVENEIAQNIADFLQSILSFFRIG